MNSVYCVCSCHVCLAVQINTCRTSSLCSSFYNRNLQTEFTFSSSKFLQGFTSLPPSNSPVNMESSCTSKGHMVSVVQVHCYSTATSQQTPFLRGYEFCLSTKSRISAGVYYTTSQPLPCEKGVYMCLEGSHGVVVQPHFAVLQTHTSYLQKGA